jgi:hypothetical protein
MPSICGICLLLACTAALQLAQVASLKVFACFHGAVLAAAALV